MEDHFDIKTLPSHFVSESHPSNVIQDLDEKRENEHNALLEHMYNAMKELNIEIEEEILNLSNTAKSKLKQIRDDTDYSIFLVLHLRENDFPNLEKTHFQNMTKNITDSNMSRKSTVDELFNTLVGIEKKRSDKFKAILNKAYSKLLEVSFKMPFELDEFFEEEILKINQLTLNNHQHYGELQAELNLQIENDMKIWVQKLYEIKDKFQKYLRDVANQQSEQRKQHEQYGFIDTTFARMNRRLSEYDAMKMVLDFKASQIYIDVDLKNIHMWLHDVQITMACLDKSAKYIVNIYKAAIVVIFHRFFKELEDIKTSMLDIDMLSREEIEPYECEIYTPTAEELNLQTDEEFENIKEVWGKLITYIEDTLHETYSFVKKSTYLWDSHFIRIDEAQDLVLLDVSNTIAKNAIIEEGAESKLHDLLDKLRQSPTEQKLEKCLEEIQKGLAKMEELFHQNDAEEQKVIEKYRELVDIEIEVLMAEINRFLILHPPDEEKDPKKQRKRASQESHINIDPNEALIPNQMLFCRYQVEAVSNWMFGLWEAINHYLAVGRAEVSSKAEDWIKLRCAKIKMRLNIKLSFFKSRYERIKCSIYEKRLEELTRHSERFKAHQMAVEGAIKYLAQKQKLYEEKYNQILITFSESTEKVILETLNSDRSHQIQRYKDNLKIITREVMESVDGIVEESIRTCDELEETIKISNFKFKNSIRLFSENGNYNAEEAKTLSQNLTKIEANAIKSLGLIRKDNKAMNGNYKTKLQARNTEASFSIEEVLQEHIHNENVVKEIVTLQNEIRNLAMSIKIPIMQLKKRLNSLLEASAGKLNRLDFLQIFSKKFQEIVEQVEKLAPYVMHPEPVTVYSSLNADRYTGDIATVDFIQYLFDAKQGDTDDCFVSKLNNSLCNSFSKIQNQAREFYMSHRILLHFPKIQPTYEQFMEEVLRKYKNFLIQGEICWFSTASDFLNFLDNILSFKKEYLLAYENKFYRASQDYYKKIQTDIMKNLNNEKENLENEFKEIHSKIKTLHGHPRNKHLLRQLEQEFEKMAKSTGGKLKTILQPQKNILSEEFQKLKSNYETTVTELDNLSQGDHFSALQTTLRNHLETKLDLMKKMIGENDRESSRMEDNQKEDIPLSVSGQIIAYMKNMQSQPQTITDFSSTLSVATTTQTEEDQTPKTPRDFLNELREDFEKYQHEITDFVNKLFKYHKEMQATWKNDIQNVVDLYKVKYDKKPETKTK